MHRRLTSYTAIRVAIDRKRAEGRTTWREGGDVFARDVLWCARNEGVTEQFLGELNRFYEAYHREVLVIRRRVFGNEH